MTLQSSQTLQTSVCAPFSLPRYEAACCAVANAKSVDEAKEFRDRAEAMRAYARQARNRQMELDAAEIRFRAERRIGELMAAQRDAGLLNAGAATPGIGKRGLEENPRSAKLPPSLAEVGIDKNLADRARKYAAIAPAEFEAILAERREQLEQEHERIPANLVGKDAKHIRGTLNTGEFEWYTPARYIDLARHVLGEIDLDPASNDIANRVVKASRFFSLEADGLTQQWVGRLWLNPPFAQPAIAAFCDKAVREWQGGHVSAAIVLTNDCTDTAWFHQLAEAASAVCFTRGRIRFESPSGKSGSPTQGQAFFYLGDRPDRFANVFCDVGLVMRRAA